MRKSPNSKTSKPGKLFYFMVMFEHLKHITIEYTMSDLKSSLWVNKQELDTLELSKNTYNWLTIPYILSKALKQRAEVFSVKLLQQAYHSLDASTQKLLQLNKHQECLVREVHLKGNNECWTYGKVIIPKDTFSALPELTLVEDKPFGESVLYNHPDMIRSNFEFCKLTPADKLFHQALRDSSQHATELWARRSVFYIATHPLLVIEVFLPALPKY